MKKLLTLIAAAFILSSCGIYSFTGTSIQPDVKTITIDFFGYRAPKVNPTLQNDISEAIRLEFRRLTKLEQVDEDGDLEISGEVTGYDVSASSISAEEVAAQNRLTITVSVNFTNRKYPEDSFERKTFSQYADYDSNNSLESVESTLCTEIIAKLVTDIFNATVAQW